MSKEITLYAEAITEVLAILKYTETEIVDKIPKKFISFLEDNSSKTYTPNFDYTQPIKNLKLNPKTKTILGIIYLKYWATEEEKKIFKKRIKKNDEDYQKQLKETYQTNNLFSTFKIDAPSNSQKHELIEIEEKTYMQKLIEKIKKFFWR